MTAHTKATVVGQFEPGRLAVTEHDQGGGDVGHRQFAPERVILVIVTVVPVAKSVAHVADREEGRAALQRLQARAAQRSASSFDTEPNPLEPDRQRILDAYMLMQTLPDS